jgi:hypothetical protein
LIRKILGYKNGSTKALPYRLIFNAYIILQKRGAEDVAPYKFSFPYAIYSLNGQGLGGSRCGSVTVRFKHHTVVFFIAAPPLRYLPVSDSTSEVYPRVDCLLVCSEFPFRFFVREFLKGVWGKLLARSFPHEKIL